jgi:hypothetical protein
MNTTRYRKTLIAATLSLAVGSLEATATAGTIGFKKDILA